VRRAKRGGIGGNFRAKFSGETFAIQNTSTHGTTSGQIQKR
jgi:hypothetical protein